MQRRAAAVYFVLFMVLGAGAYGFIQVGMSSPEVDLNGPTYTEGDTLTVNGTNYTVTTVESEIEEGSHGGGASVSYTGEVTFFNASAMGTATLEDGSSMEFQGAAYNISVPNQTEVTQFQLTEILSASDVVANDPDASAVVTDENGNQFVQFENESTVPVSEYLPEPTTFTISTGDVFYYPEEDVSTTVTDVSASGATLTWDAADNESTDFGEGENITLNGESYFAHFPSNSSVQVLPTSEYYGEYASTLSDISYYHERKNGVWGIVLISFLSALILISAAYLPNK